MMIGDVDDDDDDGTARRMRHGRARLGSGTSLNRFTELKRSLNLNQLNGPKNRQLIIGELVLLAITGFLCVCI